jgi:restriction system protein
MLSVPSKYEYSVTIKNEYLGVVKEIKGHTEGEVRMKARAQLDKWEEQEKTARSKRIAEELTENAREQQSNYATILRDCAARPVVGWSSFHRRKRYPEFSFSQTEPTYEMVAEELKVPKPGVLEGTFLFRAKKARRLEMEEQARGLYRDRTEEYQRQKALARASYEADMAKFKAEQDAANRRLDERKQAFEQGHPDAIEWFVGEAVCHGVKVPEYDLGNPDIQYLKEEVALVLNLQLPHPNQVSDVVGYKYSATEKGAAPIRLKKREAQLLYENVCFQMVLASMSTVLRCTSASQVTSVVANGWVDGVDSATGKPFRSCLLSCRSTRDAFDALDLSRVEPKECFRNLKGLTAGPLYGLAPIRPILNINREDSRFVESRDVMADVGSIPNLALMDWEDFEHLVRGLFERVFGQAGAEVKVTQASRDQGVDAIAFDPDPIRGGKFIIQAKRYTNLVPVSAVRDLYGAVINEGAAKGILVTTSHYGPDSYEFAKDKPIVLVNGQNLVHMFQEYGYEVRIDTTQKA